MDLIKYIGQARVTALYLSGKTFNLHERRHLCQVLRRTKSIRDFYLNYNQWDAGHDVDFSCLKYHPLERVKVKFDVNDVEYYVGMESLFNLMTSVTTLIRFSFSVRTIEKEDLLTIMSVLDRNPKLTHVSFKMIWYHEFLESTVNDIASKLIGRGLTSVKLIMRNGVNTKTVHAIVTTNPLEELSLGVLGMSDFMTLIPHLRILNHLTIDYIGPQVIGQRGPPGLDDFEPILNLLTNSNITRFKLKCDAIHPKAEDQLMAYMNINPVLTTLVLDCDVDAKFVTRLANTLRSNTHLCRLGLRTKFNSSAIFEPVFETNVTLFDIYTITTYQEKVPAAIDFCMRNQHNQDQRDGSLVSILLNAIE